MLICLCRTQVYIVYPEAVNLAGPSAVHDLVPNWELLERVLLVRPPLIVKPTIFIPLASRMLLS